MALVDVASASTPLPSPRTSQNGLSLLLQAIEQIETETMGAAASDMDIDRQQTEAKSTQAAEKKGSNKSMNAHAVVVDAV
ncbi:hypothetical protein N0V90_007986 [Kalmusia sp. IMI 367209]|nr:hypothetical protein N0V90_007986 [Kalmusia sp. IMI 367209]